MNVRKELGQAVKEVLGPVLAQHGFRKVKVKSGILAPEFLFERNGVWLGLSWDWRDRYFDAGIGGLFRMKDFLPRVIVLPDFDWAGQVRKKPSSDVYGDDLADKIGSMKENLAKALKRVEGKQDECAEEYLAKSRPDLRQHIVGPADISYLK